MTYRVMFSSILFLLLLGSCDNDVTREIPYYPPPPPITISYAFWHDIAPPPSPLPDSVRMYNKARVTWYNLEPSDVTVTDIWPGQTVRPGQGQVAVLDVLYNPFKRGVYNFSPDLQRTLRVMPAENWGGIEQEFPLHRVDIVRDQFEFIEFWLKTEGQIDSSARMFVELGSFSEDVIPNGRLNSEDVIRTPGNPNGFANGVLNPGEDVGLDMLADSGEQRVYASFLAQNIDDPDVNPADPSGDDWYFVPGSRDYSGLNGTEGNGNSVDGRLPDTEDMNRNGVLDTANSYFEYSVSLDTSRSNPQLANPGYNGWYHFRISLSDYAARAGSPSLFDLEGIRIWLTGFTSPIKFRFVGLNLVGR